MINTVRQYSKTKMPRIHTPFIFTIRKTVSAITAVSIIENRPNPALVLLILSEVRINNGTISIPMKNSIHRMIGDVWIEIPQTGTTFSLYSNAILIKAIIINISTDCLTFLAYLRSRGDIK